MQKEKFNLQLIIGLFLIIAGTTLSFVYKCPTASQRFTIYTLVGIGIPFLFPRNAEKTVLNYRGSRVTFVLIGASAITFILWIVNPVKFYANDECNSHYNFVNVTVFVHGNAGKQDIILRQGYVIMDSKAERKKSEIGENGQAFFQNLHLGDSVRLEIEFSEPYKSINPQAIYIIDKSGAIYFPIELKGISRVHGYVLSGNSPVESVSVTIDTLQTLTDENGSFNLDIPEGLRKKQYKVRLSKVGYKTQIVPAFPQTMEPLAIIMEKND